MNAVKAIVIIIIIGLIGFALYLYASKVANGFDFNSGLSGVNFQSLLSGSGSVDLTLTMAITNTNNFSLTINNLSVTILYQGTVIANTKTPITQVVIPSAKNGGYVTFPATITIQLNNATFGVASSIISAQPTPLGYTVSGSLFFIPFSFSGNETYPS